MYLSIIKVRMALLLCSPKGRNLLTVLRRERPRRFVQLHNHVVDTRDAAVCFRGNAHFLFS